MEEATIVQVAQVTEVVPVQAITALVAGHQAVALLLEVVASHMVVELLLEEAATMAEAVVDTINQVVQALPTVPLRVAHPQVAHPLALPLVLVSIFKEESETTLCRCA